MIPQTFVRFDPPISLRLAIRSGRSITSAEPTVHAFSSLPLWLQFDACARVITAYLPPIPRGVILYAPADFAAACPDTMDDHVQRVLQLLGTDPASALQSLIDGGKFPAPPQRVPREVAHWRIACMLEAAGKLDIIETLLPTLPDDVRSVARAAWVGKADLNRRSPLVLAAGELLGYSSADLDALFISAAAIPA